MTYYDALVEKFLHLPDCSPENGYKLLLKAAYGTKFESGTLDANREADALAIRMRVTAETGMSHKEKVVTKFGTVEKNSPSILEVWISLAVHINSSLYDSAYPDATAYWFWRMIEESGYAMYKTSLIGRNTSKHWRDEMSRMLVRFNERTYRNDGSNGAIFRNVACVENYAQMELWYQMQNWLIYV